MGSRSFFWPFNSSDVLHSFRHPLKEPSQPNPNTNPCDFQHLPCCQVSEAQLLLILVGVEASLALMGIEHVYTCFTYQSLLGRTPCVSTLISLTLVQVMCCSAPVLCFMPFFEVFVPVRQSRYPLWMKEGHSMPHTTCAHTHTHLLQNVGTTRRCALLPASSGPP